MKRFLFLAGFIILGLASKAQQYRFIYMQTDNKQTFYVRLNDKLYSSSASGYVVIPKLEAGNYNLYVGFPKNEWPVQTININVTYKDLGFVLKSFENKGWGLFNIQTMDVIYASSDGIRKQEKETTAKSTQFSDVLADVVNTPSIKEVKKEEVKAVPVKVEEIKTVVNTEKIETIADVKIDKSIKTGIQKLSSAKDADGTVMVYIDNTAEFTDTVRIIIPAGKIPVKKETVSADVTKKETVSADIIKPVVVAKEKKSDAVIIKKSDENKNAPKFIEIELPNPNAQPVEGSDTEQQKSDSEAITKVDNAVKKEDLTKLDETPKENETNTSSKIIMINSDCKQLATDDDFLMTRRKMVAEVNEEDMISTAKKLFRQKCYSTEQVKNLSVLFLNDAGKYNLFDAAYPFTHDTQHFIQLETQLTDEYYLTRFRAMIRK